jgi:hypothetical protein
MARIYRSDQLKNAQLTGAKRAVADIKKNSPVMSGLKTVAKTVLSIPTPFPKSVKDLNPLTPKDQRDGAANLGEALGVLSVGQSVVSRAAATAITLPVEAVQAGYNALPFKDRNVLGSDRKSTTSALDRNVPSLSGLFKRAAPDAPGLVKGAVTFADKVVLDPLNWLTFGVAGEGAQAGRVASKELLARQADQLFKTGVVGVFEDTAARAYAVGLSGLMESEKAALGVKEIVGLKIPGVRAIEIPGTSGVAEAFNTTAGAIRARRFEKFIGKNEQRITTGATLADASATDRVLQIGRSKPALKRAAAADLLGLSDQAFGLGNFFAIKDLERSTLVGRSVLSEVVRESRPKGTLDLSAESLSRLTAPIALEGGGATSQLEGLVRDWGRGFIAKEGKGLSERTTELLVRKSDAAAAKTAKAVATLAESGSASVIEDTIADFGNKLAGRLNVRKAASLADTSLSSSSRGALQKADILTATGRVQALQNTAEVLAETVASGRVVAEKAGKAAKRAALVDRHEKVTALLETATEASKGLRDLAGEVASVVPVVDPLDFASLGPALDTLKATAEISVKPMSLGRLLSLVESTKTSVANRLIDATGVTAEILTTRLEALHQVETLAIWKDHLSSMVGADGLHSAEVLNAARDLKLGEALADLSNAENRTFIANHIAELKKSDPVIASALGEIEVEHAGVLAKIADGIENASPVEAARLKNVVALIDEITTEQVALLGDLMHKENLSVVAKKDVINVRAEDSQALASKVFKALLDPENDELAMRAMLALDESHRLAYGKLDWLTPGEVDYVVRPGYTQSEALSWWGDVGLLWRGTKLSRYGFSVGNYRGGFINNLADGVTGIKIYREAADIEVAFRNAREAGKLLGESVDESVKAFSASRFSGVLPESQFREAFLSATGVDQVAGLLAGAAPGGKIEAFTKAVSRWQRAMEKLAWNKAIVLGPRRGATTGVESNLRLTHYLNSIDKGLTHEAALDRMLAVHFDYTDLSAADKAIKDNLMPFWMFRSRNAMLMAENMLRSPAYGRGLLQGRLALEEENPLPANFPYYATGPVVSIGNGQTFTVPSVNPGDVAGYLDNLGGGLPGVGDFFENSVGGPAISAVKIGIELKKPFNSNFSKGEAAVREVFGGTATDLINVTKLSRGNDKVVPGSVDGQYVFKRGESGYDALRRPLDKNYRDSGASSPTPSTADAGALSGLISALGGEQLKVYSGDKKKKNASGITVRSRRRSRTRG